MKLIVERVVPGLAPLAAEVRAEALAGSADRARHDALAARVPALDAIALRQPPASRPVPAAIRIAAWNAERLKRVEAAAVLLDRAGADVALLSEVDLGMARSGNRDAAADLATIYGCGFVYGVEFVELGLGDAREVAWHVGESNACGFHGAALLSRFRLADPFLVRLDDGATWFAADAGQRRLGGRMALAARLADAPSPLWVVVVHLENRSDPALRAAQVRRLLAALDERVGNSACVIGGDFNTLALPRGDVLPASVLDDPSRIEPLFADMARAGFGWAGSNTADVTSRTRPDGAPLPPFTRIDWLFARGLAARDPATLPAVDREGVAISDHDLVAATFERSGAGRSG